ncbi:glycosyltransferase family 4 protein [Psychroserpens sp. AS72]|uniref:glycosyltransferase family 4 protein n=1 Tax=Psychroserpens sp. AS72 TaxID=3135775 RepID=UPI00319DE1A7
MNNSTSDYFVVLSNKLAEEFQVVVITHKIRKTNVSLDDSITVLKWPSRKTTSWKNFWFLCKLMRVYKPSMIISMFGFVNLYLIAGWIFRVKTRLAWIRTLSSQYSQTRYKVIRKSKIYSLATHIVTNSQATKNDVVNFFKIPDHKVTILPNSVKDYSTSLEHINTSKNNFLYVGRLHRSKGIDVLIQSFALALKKFPNIQLSIIGHGAILEELMELTSVLGVSNNITFLGEKNKKDVLEAYKESYCTIIPSNSEAFGFTVIEAMSVGTCVIGANNTGIKEIIIPEESGLLFETGNSKDLATQIEKLIVNQSLRDYLATNGYQRFLNLYENDYATNRDFKFLNELSK